MAAPAEICIYRSQSASQTSAETSPFTPHPAVSPKSLKHQPTLSIPGAGSSQPAATRTAWEFISVTAKASPGSLNPPYLCPRPQPFHWHLVSQLLRVISRLHGPYRVGGLQSLCFLLPQTDLCLAAFSISCLLGRTPQSLCGASPRPKGSGFGVIHLRNPSAATSKGQDCFQGQPEAPCMYRQAL